MTYRAEIDGLRAIAVISVIIFHLNFLPNGYLGVDVFFVISGFLITNIIYKEQSQNNFSIINFYKRRVRRIIPLTMFISLVALFMGIIFMLPEDIISLAKSVIATNLFSNNILLYITSSDYWDVSINYKPLMHTWSLGIEEQFYLFYPLVFVLFRNKKKLLFFIFLLTIISLFLYFFMRNDNAKFYLLPFRFFELSIGGIFALLYFNKKEISNIHKYIYYLSYFGLIALLFLPYKKNDIFLFIGVMCSTFIITFSKYFSNNYFTKYLLSNPILVNLGKISFSLYMWHQIVFSFARYVFLFEITLPWAFILMFITLLLSILTYAYIEVPFRKITMNFKFVASFVLFFFFINISISTYLLSVEGVYKNFVVFGQYKNDFSPNIKKLYRKDLMIGSMQNYNENINNFDKPFDDSNKIKILIIGDSFARDVANVILEGKQAKNVNISYINTRNSLAGDNYAHKVDLADFVFLGFGNFFSKKDLKNFETNHHCSFQNKKIYYFGTKNFGYNMGLPYNAIRFENHVDYKNYYTKIREEYAEEDQVCQREWGAQFISFLAPVLTSDRKKVRCFDDEGKFISHDSAHLSKFGAQFYSKYYAQFFDNLLSPKEK